MTLTAPVGDGIADDHGAVMDYINARVPLPPGTFRITQKLDLRSTAAGVSAGWTVEGTHRRLSTILADYNETDPKAGIVDIAPNAISKYSYGTSIRNLSFKAAPGRTGHSAIALTAAWFVKIDNVDIEGMSRHGIQTPLRLDLHPTISDYYQDFGVSVKRSVIRNCGGNGLEFTSGQSPGLYVIRHNILVGNCINIRISTGQGIINQNGLYEGRVGGLLFDTVEGPSMCAEVTQNEIQNNKYWGVNVYRSRNMNLSRNRLLSQASGNLQPVSVNFGLGNSGYEVHGLIAEQNLFRSDMASGAYGFITGANTFASASPSYFRANRFDVPAGFGKYVGFNSATDGSVIQP
jgi:hypothetical protein